MIHLPSIQMRKDSWYVLMYGIRVFSVLLHMATWLLVIM